MRENEKCISAVVQGVHSCTCFIALLHSVFISSSLFRVSYV